MDHFYIKGIKTQFYYYFELNSFWELMFQIYVYFKGFNKSFSYLLNRIKIEKKRQQIAI